VFCLPVPACISPSPWPKSSGLTQIPTHYPVWCDESQIRTNYQNQILPKSSSTASIPKYFRKLENYSTICELYSTKWNSTDPCKKWIKTWSYPPHFSIMIYPYCSINERKQTKPNYAKIFDWIIPCYPQNQGSSNTWLYPNSLKETWRN
jgi:hypothetical protein